MALPFFDRVIQHMIVNVIEPEVFDRSMESRFGHMKHADSYTLIESTKGRIKEIKERKTI